MNLYYYSFFKKKFVQFFPLRKEVSAIQPAGILNTRGFVFLAWPLYIVGAGATAYIAAWWAKDAVLTGLLKAVAFLAWLFFQGASWFLISMSWILDMSIQATISSDLYKNLQVINVGWTTVRDFSNMFFIFALLYIAISTILGMAGGSTKRWVANLIIAAILINFSLFATKVVIDAGNVLAMGFWEKMNVTVNGQTAPSAGLHLIQGLKSQTALDPKDAYGKPLEMEDQKRALVYFGSGLTMLIAGYVFLAGAIIMIVRTVTLIFLMIASPFAFFSYALPVGGGYASKWFSSLISNTFVAPAFVAMLYLDSIIINSLDLSRLATADNGGQQPGFAGAFSGDMGSFPIIYNFFFVIVLMLTSLKVASSVSSGAGEMGGKWAKVGLGKGAGAAMAGGAMGGRQFGGRIGKMVGNSKKLKELAGGSSRVGRFMGNLGLATGEKMKKGTWDARNVSVAGVGINSALGLGGINSGSGGKKTFETHGGKIVGATLAGATKLGSKIPGKIGEAIAEDAKNYKPFTSDYLGSEREKEIIETAKKRYATDPAAQRQYLIDKGVMIEEKRNKDAMKEIDRAIKTKEYKDIAVGKDNAPSAQVIKIRDAEKEVHDMKAAQKRGEVVDMKKLAEAETKLETEMEVLVDALKQLTGKEFEETVNSKNITPEIMRAMGRNATMHVNANPDLFDKATRDQMTNEIMTNGQEESRQYLISQSKLNAGHLPINLGTQLESRVNNYKSEMELLKNAGDSVETRTAIAKLNEEHDSAVQDILGGMKPKDVARLNNALKSDAALVRNYTDKHFDEIENYHTNIAGDTTDPNIARMFSKIRVNALSGTNATKKKMNSAGASSVYAGDDLLKKLMEIHLEAKEAVKAANTELAAATARADAGAMSRATTTLEKATRKERKASAELDKLVESTKADGSAASATADDVFTDDDEETT